MKAIILTAGTGARMQPLTRTCHKSLLEAGGSAILARIMDGLLAIGVRDIVVVTGHLHEQVEAFLGRNYPNVAIEFVHNARYRETNNIVSLALAFEHVQLDSDVILIECDVLFDPDLLHRLVTPEPGNLALVDHYRPGMDGTVVSVEDGVITQVFPPHLQTEDFDYRGKFKTVNIYRFDRDFCRSTFQPLLSCYAHVIDSGCYYELVLGMLINMQRQRVRAVVVERGQWAEVDDPNDLAAARFAFEPERRGKILGEALGGHWNFEVLDFSFMRNQYFPTDAMLAAMRRALPELARSYGSAQPVLDQKLAYALDCQPQRLLCLNGGAQVYPWLPALLGNARRVLLPQPTFNEYPRWFAHHETYADLPSDVAAFDLVVVVSPNNPTGATISTEVLHTLAARHSRTVFVVDESFVAFSGETPLLQRLEAGPLDNVLVVGSLSKCWGVPGLRLGYAYSANSGWMQQLRAQVPIWNMNAPAEFFLELVLKFQSELADSYVRTAADRAALAEMLRPLPGVAEVYPSGGDFLLVRLEGEDPRRAAAVVEHLLQRHSIYVKDVSAKFAPARSHLRVAVRAAADHERLVAALAQALPAVMAAAAGV